tara:strand:- start:826 stop:1227 length:402 start_codon:yes stop_codon:yes gene_type:complete
MADANSAIEAANTALTRYMLNNGNTVPIRYMFKSGKGIVEARGTVLEQILVTEENLLKPGEATDEMLADAWEAFRHTRNVLLSESDWTQAVDSPLTNEQKAEWVTYRQILRDLPGTLETFDEITGIEWPDKPA